MWPRLAPLIKATAKWSHTWWLHLVAMFSRFEEASAGGRGIHFVTQWWCGYSCYHREQSLAQMDPSVDPQCNFSSHLLFNLLFICFVSPSRSSNETSRATARWVMRLSSFQSGKTELESYYICQSLRHESNLYISRVFRCESQAKVSP